MEWRSWLFKYKGDEKQAGSGQKLLGMQEDRIGSQGRQQTVVLEEEEEEEEEEEKKKKKKKKKKKECT